MRRCQPAYPFQTMRRLESPPARSPAGIRTAVSPADAFSIRKVTRLVRWKMLGNNLSLQQVNFLERLPSCVELQPLFQAHCSAQTMGISGTSTRCGCINAHVLSWRFRGAVPNPTPRQLDGIRAACLLGRKILDAAHAAIRPGITTDEIDKVVSLDEADCIARRRCKMFLLSAVIRPPHR